MFQRLALPFFFLIICLSNQAFAQNSKAISASPVKPLIGFAVEGGGDSIAEIQFDDGDTQQVHAGQGISAMVGGEFAIPSLNFFRLQATVGFKYVTTAADNAHIRLTRIPFEVTTNFLINPEIRVAAGFSYHTNIQFKADGVGPDAEFDNAIGPLFEISYSGFGIRFISMEYQGPNGSKFSANSFGATYKFAFD
jgi:hypothetical protein